MISRAKVAQIVILLIIVALCVILVGSVWRKRVRPVDKKNRPAASTQGEMKLNDMKFTEMQEGKRYWTLRASEAKYFQNEQKTLMHSVRLIFFLDNAGHVLKLKSREGVLYAGTKNIDLKGNIEVKLPHDYTATMQTAHYNHREKMVKSASPVHLIGPGLVLDGKRWQYSMDNHTAEVDGGVSVSLVLGELKIGK